MIRNVVTTEDFFVLKKTPSLLNCLSLGFQSGSNHSPGLCKPYFAGVGMINYMNPQRDQKAARNLS